MDVELPDAARAVAVLLHPHPHMGGDRFNHVIGTLHRALPAAGIGSIRFDFRSADLDEAAVDTVRAIDVAADAGVPLVVVGYSFGAMVALRVDDPRVAGWFLVALPVDHAPESTLPRDPRPKALAVPEHDFAPPDRVAAATSAWDATTVEVLPGADHFIGVAAPTVADLVVRWVEGTVLGVDGGDGSS